MCRLSSNDAPSGHAYIDCDSSYRDARINCMPMPRLDPSGNPLKNSDGSTKMDVVGSRPSCPAKPMPMIKTPARSLIADYSPSLYTYLRDPQDATRPYNGLYSIGASEGPDRVFGMFGNAPKNTTRLSSCVQQIQLPNPNFGTADEAKQVRLQIDNCTNQYILNWAIYPYQKSRSRLVNDPTVSGDPITLDTECQPLKTFPESENEYSASEYLEVAWRKTLTDASYRKQKPILNIPKVILDVLGGTGFKLPPGIVGGTEPHLPEGVTLANPIQPPSPFPDVRLSMIGAHTKRTFTRADGTLASEEGEFSVEEINDPTHPYSPRWDYAFTDRDYSALVKAAGYMTDEGEKNSVYCAGVHKSEESDKVKKANDMVKVDVLSFREKAFTAGIANRVAFNMICQKDEDGDDTEDFPFLKTMALSYCYFITEVSMIEFAVSCYFGDCDLTILQAKKRACWKCFKLKEDEDVDDEETHPPCSTHHGGKDLKIKAICNIFSPCIPGLRNGFGRTASCNVIPPFGRKGDQNIDTLCNNLRKPFTPLNKLKMRYHNPNDKENMSLKEGVPEGYQFQHYFGNHMPYPRLWDTGTSLHRSNVQDRNYQDPNDTTGQFTTIVGVGREGATDKATSEEKKAHVDERCMLGGWGGLNGGGYSTGDLIKDYGINEDGTFPTASYLATHPPLSMTGLKPMAINLPDPITSWTELKLYQARTERNANISCIGRYEKVYKSGSSENLILAALGGEWTRIIVQKCPKDKSKTDQSCTFMSLKEYNDSTKDPQAYYTIPQSKQESWPLAWRGYMAAGTGTAAYQTANLMPSGVARNVAMATAAGITQFPQLGNATTAAITSIAGLHNAQLGDVVMLPRGGAVDGMTKPALAKVGLVAEVSWGPECNQNNTDTSKKTKCFVRLLEADNGKWPDTCGTTDTWGQMKTRYIYPVELLPKLAKEEYQRIGSNGSCEDTKISPCQLSSFYSVAIYRPSEKLNIRAGCGAENGSDCK